MRLMVDLRHQRNGYVRAALKQLLALFRAHPQPVAWTSLWNPAYMYEGVPETPALE